MSRKKNFLEDNPGRDSFGRLRVSQPYTLFDSSFQYNKLPILWNEKIVGGASSTHRPNTSSIDMTVSSTNDRIVRQTKSYFKYLPGKSHQIYITNCLDANDSGVYKRVGYFDDNNGIFLEKYESDINLVLRSKITGSVVDTKIAQVDWNIDSYSVLRSTLSNFFVIDLQWLGVGRVRCGFMVDGQIRYVHEFKYSNILNTVYMTTATLPIRYEIKRFSGSGDSTLKQICSSVNSEGGYEKYGLIFSADTKASSISISQRRPVLSIRPKLLFNSIENRVPIFVQGTHLNLTAPAKYEIVLNPVLSSGTSWSDIDTNSCMEHDYQSSGISGGTTIKSGYVSPTYWVGGIFKEELEKIPLSLNIDGDSQDILTLVLTPTSVEGTAALASISWRELQ